MNSKFSLREVAGGLQARGRRGSPGGSVLIKWPAMDGWLGVADEAVRTACACRCAAAALEPHEQFHDIVEFLRRRAGMLLRLVDTLASGTPCEDRIRALQPADVLSGMIRAEERLGGRVKHLLTSRGFAPSLVKMLEQEYILSQTSHAQIRLAQMEKKEGEKS